MTEPLQTLADIDAKLIRSCETRAAAVLEIRQHRALIVEHEAEIADLHCAVAMLDEAFDEMLLRRFRVAALEATG